MDNFLASFEETQAEELKRVGDLQMQARQYFWTELGGPFSFYFYHVFQNCRFNE